jgi:ABC-type glycerol-3-phosphate transport system substrate-binding protein
MAGGQKALVVCLLAAVASAFALEAIDAPAPSDGRVHVLYWEKWTGFEFTGIKAIVDDFNASQNRIHVDLLSEGHIDDKTMFAVSAGVPPDVAGLYSYNVPQYADERSVIPLDDFCKANGIRESDYIPSYWHLMSYGGHVWALPTTPATTALHYNRSMLAAAGLDPNRPPRTIEELDAMCTKLEHVSAGHATQVGFLPSEPGWWNWSWVYFFGGNLWDGTSRMTTDSPENIAAMTWVQSFSKRMGPDAVTKFKSGLGQFDSPENGFMTGQVAMEMQGVWMHNFKQKFAPDLDAGAVAFPYPASRPDLANSTVVDCDILVIPRGAKHPKEAFEFIKYVQQQKVMEKLCLSHEKNSPLANISDHFWAVHKNPWIRLFDSLARSKNAILPPRVGLWPEIQSDFAAEFDEVVIAHKTPEQALRDLGVRDQPRLDEYLARERRREQLGL